jgi:hypothetical protein
LRADDPADGQSTPEVNPEVAAANVVVTFHTVMKSSEWVS